MTLSKIVVYDDQLDIAQRWAAIVQEICREATVESANREDFRQLLQTINDRRVAWRESAGDSNISVTGPIDHADVVILDYDLLQYSDPGDTTGSRMAYLLRCYSKCGVIMILNEFGVNVFDLSLGRAAQGFADVFLGDMQLSNAGLWKKPFHGYRPWYWPVITDIRADFDRCVADVQSNPDAGIVDFLGLHRVIDWMPRRARDFLSGKQSIEHVTFRQFVESSVGGIAGKDKLISGQMARVAAARIRTLLNVIILPDQNALVDAPHLISRFPSLIGDQIDDIAIWNRLCMTSNDEVDTLTVDSLDQYRFKPVHWLWRPAWFWPEISKDESISEVRDPWTIEEVDWVFCEDLSQFVPTEYARGFRAMVAPPYNKRFLFDRGSAEAWKYLIEIGGRDIPDPTEVEYLPQAVFSL